MNMKEISPILVLIFISAMGFAVAAILAIRSKKSRLIVDDRDFIDIAIQNKKKSIENKVGCMSWKMYVTLLTICPISLCILSLLFISSKPLCIVFAAIGLFIPELIIRRQIKKNEMKFSQNYAASLRTLAAALSAGRSVEQAIEDVSNNAFVEEHLKNCYKQMSSDIKVGITIEDAFIRFAETTGNEDARDVAAAMSLQLKVGGSESVVISAAAQNIYERIITRKEIKGYFASVDVFINLMDFLPWGAMLFLFLFSPQYMAPYVENSNLTLTLVCILVFTTIGSFLVRRKIKKAKGVQ